MTSETISGRKQVSSLIRSFLTRRTLWGGLLGAMVGIVVCPLGGLLGWWMGAHNRPLTVVWTLDLESAGWRGAFIGLLMGWQGRSRKTMWIVVGISMVALTLYDWICLILHHVLPQNVFNIRVTLHFLLNIAIIGGVVYLLLTKEDHSQKVHTADSTQQEAPQIDQGGETTGEPDLPQEAKRADA